MVLLQLLFLISGVSAIVQTIHRQESIIAPGFYPPFSQYVLLFNKVYTGQEFIERQALYKFKLKQIISHNEHPRSSYLEAINNFTDWKISELQRLANYRPNTINREEGQQITANFRQQRAKNKIRRLAASNLDWRTLGAVTSVRDQGSCGSCWAFAAVAAAQSYVITLNNANNTLELSQQFPLMCTPNNDCDGGFAQDAANIIAQYGCPNRSIYPYDPSSSSTTICQNISSFIPVATGRNVYYDITDEEIISLLQASPVTADVYASSWFNYHSGVLSCGSSAVYSDHVIQLIGYTSTYWIVKNQWGTSWGQRGFGFVTRSRSTSYTNCLIGTGIVQYRGNPIKNPIEKYEYFAIFVLAKLLMIFLFLL